MAMTTNSSGTVLVEGGFRWYVVEDENPEFAGEWNVVCQSPGYHHHVMGSYYSREAAEAAIRDNDNDMRGEDGQPNY